LPGQRFPIAVEPQMLSWRVSLDGEMLNPVAERQMEQIAADYSENGNGAITIASTARDPNAPARATDDLVSLGVQRNRIIMVPAAATDAPGTVTISYVRYRAVVTDCGIWNENLGVTWRNTPSPNLGCATQHNV